MQRELIDNDINFIDFQDKISRYKTQSFGTLHLYTVALRRFCNYTELTPTQVLDLGKSNMDELLKSIDRFVRALYDPKTQDISSSTVYHYVMGVKKFLVFNRVRFAEGDFESISLPIPETRTKDRIPELDELGKCYNVTNLRGKTLLSTLISTGMRRGEARLIRVKDIQFEEPLTWIQLEKEYTKGRKERIVLASPQCSELLKEYIRVMNKTGEDRVFPLTSGAVWVILTNIFEKAGILTKDQWGYNIIHPHCTRKFFKTYCSVAGIHSDFSEMLLGHKKYLDASYLRANYKMITEIYSKALPYLTIQETTVDIREVQALRRSLNENQKDKEIQSLRDEIKQLNADRAGMTEQMGEVLRRLKRIEELKKEE